MKIKTLFAAVLAAGTMFMGARSSYADADVVYMNSAPFTGTISAQEFLTLFKTYSDSSDDPEGDRMSNRDDGYLKYTQWRDSVRHGVQLANVLNNVFSSCNIAIQGNEAASLQTSLVILWNNITNGKAEVKEFPEGDSSTPLVVVKNNAAEAVWELNSITVAPTKITLNVGRWDTEGRLKNELYMTEGDPVPASGITSISLIGDSFSVNSSPKNIEFSGSNGTVQYNGCASFGYINDVTNFFNKGY